MEPAASRLQNYFPALTGLRFVLAIWVILHHLIGKGMMLEDWALTLPGAAAQLLRGGYLAVQTFFLLSGFVLARTYARTKWNRETLARFGMARFARIYPVYLLSLAVVARFAIEMLSRPGRTAFQKAALLGDYSFILIGWMKPLGVGWNTPAWSLSCELFFYLLFPRVLFGLRQAGWARLSAAFCIAMILPIALDHAGVPAVWKPVHHFADFLAGIAAAGLLESIRGSRIIRLRRGHWLYLPAIALGLALIAHPEVLRGSMGDLNTVLRPLNVALLIGLAAGGGWGAGVLSLRWSEYLGKASYSMYILHVPLLWWYSRYAFHQLGPAPHGMSALAFLIGVVLISMAVFEFVEVPANRWLRLRPLPTAR